MNMIIARKMLACSGKLVKFDKGGYFKVLSLRDCGENKTHKFKSGDERLVPLTDSEFEAVWSVYEENMTRSEMNETLKNAFGKPAVIDTMLEMFILDIPND